jgi:hypothetical protein
MAIWLEPGWAMTPIFTEGILFFLDTSLHFRVPAQHNPVPEPDDLIGILFND